MKAHLPRNQRIREAKTGSQELTHAGLQVKVDQQVDTVHPKEGVKEIEVDRRLVINRTIEIAQALVSNRVINIVQDHATTHVLVRSRDIHRDVDQNLTEHLAPATLRGVALSGACAT